MTAISRPARSATFVFTTFAAVRTVLCPCPAWADIPDAWKPGLYWQQNGLHMRAPNPHKSVQDVIRLINRAEFGETLAAVERVQGPEVEQRKAELALAVAGHLDVFDPEPALSAAETHIERALAAAPEEVALLRMRNQIDLYRAVPGFGLPTDPLLLPARDLIAAGKVEAGRKRAAQRKARIVARAWVIASFFERRKDVAILLDDAEKALRESESAELIELLLEHRQHAWASLSVQPDSLLYPRVLLGRMRAYYWWWRQQGERYRPMSKQGFLELREEIGKFFPNHDSVRMYRGERLPWGEGFRPGPAPAGAPGWAVNQRELRARVDHVVEWWFAHRQAANGELGGGWEDDCETLRKWAVTALCCGNPRIEAGIKRLVDGIWTSGQLVDGYDRALKDVEHSSEMAADTSTMVALAYGDPLYFERFLETTRTTLEVHTAVNAHGHRHFKLHRVGAALPPSCQQDDLGLLVRRCRHAAADAVLGHATWRV